MIACSILRACPRFSGSSVIRTNLSNLSPCYPARISSSLLIPTYMGLPSLYPLYTWVLFPPFAFALIQSTKDIFLADCLALPAPQVFNPRDPSNLAHSAHTGKGLSLRQPCRVMLGKPGAIRVVITEHMEGCLILLTDNNEAQELRRELFSV